MKDTCPLVWFFQSKELQTEPLDIYLDDIVNKVIYKVFNMLPFF